MAKIVLLLCAISCLRAQPTDRATAMDRSIRAAIAPFPGTVGLYAKNLDTGATYGIREDERVRTASTIKLPIMTAIFQEVADGRAKWKEELTLHDQDKVSGSGVLREFSDGVHVPIPDLVHLMIVVSDNTATNLLLDRFGGDVVNAYMDRIGLKQTRSLRKILGDGNPSGLSGLSHAGRLEENRPFGLGVSTPREMGMLLEKLERGEVVNPDASREMIKILKRQQDRTGIGRKVEFPVANKSGALDRLRSDVGIVYAPGGRIVIAITCDNLPKTDYSPDNVGSLFISRLTGIIVEGLSGK